MSEDINLREPAGNLLKFNLVIKIDAVVGDHVLIDYGAEMGYHSMTAAL
jgi:hypothetical protein